MSFNRSYYDKQAERDRLNSSKGIGNYALQTPKQFSAYPDEGIIPQRAGYNMDVAVENSLFNMNQQATYYPEQPDAIYGPSQYNNRFLFFLPEDRGFEVESTRISNPPSTLKGTGINRFDPICIDPQANIFFPGVHLTQTRQQAKDSHRRCKRTFNINSMNPDQSI
jgi:hypothetical protein